MPSSAYTKFDYPSYWRGRKYEHDAEIIVLKHFFDQIPESLTIIEIGAGYGRLAKFYLKRVKKALLLEPSRMLRNKAKKDLSKKFKNYELKEGYAQKLPVKSGSYDLALMVRVIHHIEDPGPAFAEVARVLKEGGYFILEFANKIHWKARFRAFLKGDSHFLARLKPLPLQKLHKTFTFVNHHPKKILFLLREEGFGIVDMHSVSNLRHPKIKLALPHNILTLLEKYLQEPLAQLRFGPSIFVLARKKANKSE